MVTETKTDPSRSVTGYVELGAYISYVTAKSHPERLPLSKPEYLSLRRPGDVPHSSRRRPYATTCSGPLVMILGTRVAVHPRFRTMEGTT